MPSLVATTSTPARKPFVRTHYVRTNNICFPLPRERSKIKNRQNLRHPSSLCNLGCFSNYYFLIHRDHFIYLMLQVILVDLEKFLKIRMPEFGQCPKFSQFYILECSIRVISICFHKSSFFYTLNFIYKGEKIKSKIFNKLTAPFQTDQKRPVQEHVYIAQS